VSNGKSLPAENKAEVEIMDEIRTDWPAGVKRTKQRESLLAALGASEKPLSAPDISFRMKEAGRKASLSTVYRILDLFVSKGLVIKINVMNSDMSLYELNYNKHKHYAVCLSCHKIIEMEHCPFETFMPELENGDFHVTGHNLEIYGVCKECKLK
jgi:Fur family ferric uptake transcriptional regulator